MEQIKNVLRPVQTKNISANFKSEQNVISLLNHVATIATVAEELCSSDFQWGIKTPTESLNGTRRLRGGGHLRQGYISETACDNFLIRYDDF